MAQDALAKKEKEMMRILGINVTVNIPNSVFNAVIIEAIQILFTRLNSCALAFQNEFDFTKFSIIKTSFSIIAYEIRGVFDILFP